MLAPVRRRACRSATRLASLRGWPAFYGAVEAAREKAGAAWVGAPTYGVAAQLAAAPQLHAPATEIFERERYTFETPAERADFSKPGLVVVPARGAGAQALRGCFADVQLLPEIDRGAGRGMTPYTVLRVAGPTARRRTDRLLPPAPGEVLIRPAGMDLRRAPRLELSC